VLERVGGLGSNQGLGRSERNKINQSRLSLFVAGALQQSLGWRRHGRRRPSPPEAGRGAMLAPGLDQLWFPRWPQALAVPTRMTKCRGRHCCAMPKLGKSVGRYSTTGPTTRDSLVAGRCPLQPAGSRPLALNTGAVPGAVMNLIRSAAASVCGVPAPTAVT
jgi:hypothetical protein